MFRAMIGGMSCHVAAIHVHTNYATTKIEWKQTKNEKKKKFSKMAQCTLSFSLWCIL